MPKFLIVLFFIVNSFFVVQNSQAQKNGKKRDTQEQIISNFIESSVSFRDSSMNLSLEFCDKAINLAQKEKADSLLALAFKTQGINYYYLREFDSSLVYYNKSIISFEALGNKIQVGKMLGNIGLIYKNKGEYSKALEYYLEEVDIFLSINYIKGLSGIYSNIGVLFVSMGEYEKAENKFQKALAIADQNNNDGEKVKALSNLGALYEKQDRLDEALKAFEKSRSLIVNNGNSVMLGTLYLNIAVVHRRMKNLHLASEFLDKSFNLRKLRGVYHELLGVYHEKYEIALCKEDYINAKHLIGTMKDLAEINSDPEWLSDVYVAYTNLYKAIGDYRLAFDSYEQHLHLNDSIQKAMNETKYNELMIKYDLNYNRQEMELMTQETKIQRLELDKKNAWLVAMVVIMLLGIITIVVSFRINKLKAEHKLMSLDQKVLLSQMNPHFLFNALTAVQCLVLEDEKDKANLYLAELGNLVRSILEDSRKEAISLRQELSILDKYIGLQKLRFDFPLEFRFDIGEDIDLDELKIPPMLTQPFIENSLVHANLQEVAKPEILIKLKLVDNNFVEFSIQDNGIGIEEGKKQSLMKEKESLAMQIANDRIQIYNFKSKYRMKLDIVDLKHIDNNSQGTLARFTIPTQS